MKTRSRQWFDLFEQRCTRRDFARIGAGLSAVLAMGGLPACAGDRRPRFTTDPFELGVASGDPWADGVVLWTRLTGAAMEAIRTARERVPVRWEVAEDDSFRRIVQSGAVWAVPELGYSAHAEVQGLRPGREYWYRFDAGGLLSPMGRTRTAYAPDADPDRLRFAFASCQHCEQGLYTSLRHMASDDLDLIVHLGDYIYERSTAEPLRHHEAGEVHSLDDYRGRYTTYRSDADLRAAHASAPWIVTFDDHEVDNNWADEAAEDDQSPAELLLRRAAAFQAYYEFMPLRRPQQPSGPDIQMYRRLRFGSLAEFNVLDTRQYRSDQPCGDRLQPPCPDADSPDQDMLGPQQERWLFEGLASSTARWNVLANQVMVSQVRQIRGGELVYSMDQWGGYKVARQRLLDFLGTARPPNPVVLTGDIHTNWVVDLKRDFDREDSEVVGTEFVGTSLSSGGDGADALARSDALRSDNPHLHLFNAQRGYVRCTLTPERWRTEYRVVPYVSRPGAAMTTRATFTVENGRPGAQEGS